MLSGGFLCNILANRNVSVFTTDGGGSATCPDNASPDVQEATDSNDDELSLGRNNSPNFSVGQGLYSDATTRTICKVGFFIRVGAGNTSAKNYVVKIYTMTGDALNTVIANGTSDVVTGFNSGTFVWTYFSWSGAKPVMTGGTTYAFVLEATSAVDAANYILAQAPLLSTISGNKMGWSNLGVAEINSATYEMNIKIFWYD
jgi:hypothetical protein